MLFCFQTMAAETADLPLDLLETQLDKSKPSQEAVLLQKAFDAWKKDRCFVSFKHLSKISQNSSFVDFKHFLNAACHYQEAKKKWNLKKYAEVISHTQKAIQLGHQAQRFAYTSLSKKSQQLIGENELLLGKSLTALKRASQAMPHLASGFNRLQDTSVDFESAETYAKICKKNPSSFCTSWIKKLAPSYSDPLSKQLQAFFPEIFKKTTSISKKSPLSYKNPDSDTVLFEESIHAYSDKQLTQAQKGFRKLLQQYPRSSHRTRTQYWLAQTVESSEAQSILSEIQAQAPLTYYALLASKITQQSPDHALSAELPLANTEDPRLNPSSNYHLHRAEVFLKAKAMDLAIYELENIVGIESFSSPFLTYLTILNYRAKNHKKSFQILNELFQRNDHVFSSYHLRLVFPIEFFKTIEEHSKQNALDPILVLSLIKQESAFAPEAYSRAKAIGAMQILLSTARNVDATITLENLLELPHNIRIGTKYLSQLLERYHGNTVMALAAYNAGPGAVDRWIKNNSPKLSSLLWIESIPYKETRNYVTSIMRNYYWYTRKLQDPNVSFEKILNLFWKDSMTAQGT